MWFCVFESLVFLLIRNLNRISITKLKKQGKGRARVAASRWLRMASSESNHQESFEAGVVQGQGQTSQRLEDVATWKSL